MTSQGHVSVKYCQEVVIGWAGGQEGLQRGGSVLTAGSLRFCLSSKTRGGLRSGRWRGTQAKDCLLLSSRNEGRRASSHQAVLGSEGAEVCKGLEPEGILS